MRVIVSKKAKKQLRKVPLKVQAKLEHWMEIVEKEGVFEVRKIPGFHDEPLKGHREGQRSIRLSRSWRAIYHIVDNIIVIEVTHHDYR